MREDHLGEGFYKGYYMYRFYNKVFDKVNDRSDLIGFTQTDWFVFISV